MHLSARRLAVGTVALCSSAVLAACGSSTDHTGMPGMTSSTSMQSPSPAGASATAAAGDVMFAQMMIPHHEQAVVMADLALEDRAEASEEVRRLAGAIKAAQGPEIRTMKAWLSSWGASAAGAMNHGMPGMMGETDMAALGAATGADFDRQWLTMMIEHHQGAVTMSQDVLDSTTNQDVRKLAQSIVTAQEQEIATMQTLLG